MPRRRRASSTEPSLVPLADMLTNTVGVIIFILIFTVLTAGGVVVVKRLPIERATQDVPLRVLCVGNRLLPLESEVILAFLAPLGEPRLDDAAWRAQLVNRRHETDLFLLNGDKTADDRPFFAVTPRQGRGEALSQFRDEGSHFRRTLATHAVRSRFVYFIVGPDCIDAFSAAREIAIGLGFDVGWLPIDDPVVRFSLDGKGGIAAVSQ